MFEKDEKEINMGVDTIGYGKDGGTGQRTRVRGVGARGDPRGWARSSDQDCKIITERTCGGERIALRPP